MLKNQRVSIQGLAVNAPVGEHITKTALQSLLPWLPKRTSADFEDQKPPKNWRPGPGVWDHNMILWTDSCGSPNKFMGIMNQLPEMAVFFSPSLLDVYDIESTTILRFTNHKSGIRHLSKVLVEIKHEGWTWANNRTQTKHKPNTTSFGDDSS